MSPTPFDVFSKLNWLKVFQTQTIIQQSGTILFSLTPLESFLLQSWFPFCFSHSHCEVFAINSIMHVKKTQNFFTTLKCYYSVMNFKKTGVNVVAVKLLVAGLWSKGRCIPRAAQDEWLQVGTAKVSASPVRGGNAEMAASGVPNQQLVSILNWFCSYIWKLFLAQLNKNRATVEETFLFPSCIFLRLVNLVDS